MAKDDPTAADMVGRLAYEASLPDTELWGAEPIRRRVAARRHPLS